jgi:hypothetical protein
VLSELEPAGVPPGDVVLPDSAPGLPVTPGFEVPPSPGFTCGSPVIAELGAVDPVVCALAGSPTARKIPATARITVACFMVFLQ